MRRLIRAEYSRNISARSENIFPRLEVRQESPGVLQDGIMSCHKTCVAAKKGPSHRKSPQGRSLTGLPCGGLVGGCGGRTGEDPFLYDIIGVTRLNNETLEGEQS